jgi:YggT family protein
MALVQTLVGLLESLIRLYELIVILAVVVSWLIAFNVINTYNNFVRSLVRFLDAITEPAFRRIRKVIPPIGGLDLSPLVVLIVLAALNYFLKTQFGDFEFF